MIDRKERIAQRWQVLAFFSVAMFVLWRLGPVLTPFVISALLAWLGDPLVRRLERTGRSRAVAVSTVFLLMSSLLAIALLVLVPMLERQISTFIDWLPRLTEWITTRVVPEIEKRLQIDLSNYLDKTFFVEMVKTNWQRGSGVAANVVGGISKSGLAILGWVANLVLIPVVTFYFMRDWPRMVEQLRGLLPRRVEPTVVRLAQESDAVLGGFVRGQFSVMLALGSIYASGLWLIGLDLGLLIGFAAGLASFVPYLGAFFGVAAAIIASLVEHGDLMHLGLVFVVFGVGQIAENFFLVPWLVGDRIGMHPVAVIFAIMAGGQLFGFVGVLLALPVAAVVMVVLRYAYQRYTESALYCAPEENESVIISLAEAAEAEHAAHRDKPEHFPFSGPGA